MSAFAEPRSRRYELSLLLVLTLANGVVALDRLTAAFLSPYLVADLKLDNTKLGLLGGALSLAVAISAYLGGKLADRTGRQKSILLVCTVLFSLGSAAGGFAAGFGFLLACRFLLGLAEGPMVPISQAVMVQTSAPQRRGFNMGVMQMAGAFLIAGMLGPVLVTKVADAYGWRHAFYLSAVPGVLLAIALMAVMKPDRAAITSAAEVPVRGGITRLLAVPNMRVILLIAGLFTGWLAMQNVFLPVFLTQVKGLAPQTMGWVVGMGGVAGVIGGAAIPALSDRVGRKPVCIAACLAGLGAPIAMLVLPGSPVLLGLAILIGWLPLGVAPLYCAAIPSESVPPALATSAIGLAMATAELLGGMAAPALAGTLADRFGLQAVFWLCGLFALIAAALATRLRETAPAIFAPGVAAA